MLAWFLNVSSTTRLYRGRAPRQSVRQFYVLSHMRQSWETMTSVSAGHTEAEGNVSVQPVVPESVEKKFVVGTFAPKEEYFNAMSCIAVFYSALIKSGKGIV